MRLDAVYLLGTSAEPPRPSRRRFVLALGGALGGLAVGGMLVCVTGSRLSREASVLLEWARSRCAESTPFEVLFSGAGPMLIVLAEEAPEDCVLWSDVRKHEQTREVGTACGGKMKLQGGPGITGPSVAAPGETVEVVVSNGARTLTVMVGAGPPTKITVGADGKAKVPIPANAPPGGQVHVRDDRIPPSYLRIEVVASLEGG